MKIEAIYKQIGQRIREERQRAGVSQEWLAQRIGLTRTSVLNIEHGGRQRVHIHTIAQIAKALNIQQRRIYRGVL
jgi:DNA-binding XRE family transcriptional regulator